ncbi:MAG TPA: CBS domain-containing protein [Terriglobia bacterium]|jgi:CBS domain-containing protein
MKAEEIMNTPIIAASKKASAREVALYMLLGGFSGVPIAEPDGSLAGIVTELDLLRALRLGRSLDTTSVDEIMTPDVLSVDVETSIEEIMEILDTQRIQRVPVTNCGKLVGIVSRPDVIRAVVQPQFIRIG